MNNEDERQGQPSASSFARYELCPGSFQLEAEARRIGQAAHQTDKNAERGTRIHAWLAQQGPFNETIPESEKVVLEGEELVTGEALLERANEQIRHIFGDQWDGHVNAPQPVQVLREKRLWLK